MKHPNIVDAIEEQLYHTGVAESGALALDVAEVVFEQLTAYRYNNDTLAKAINNIAKDIHEKKNPSQQEDFFLEVRFDEKTQSIVITIAEEKPEGHKK